MGLQENRMRDEWKCEICGKRIEGKRNTIHLAVLSHCKAEERKGLRTGYIGRYNLDEK